MSIPIKISAPLQSIAADGVVASSHALLDEEMNMRQSEINQLFASGKLSDVRTANGTIYFFASKEDGTEFDKTGEESLAVATIPVAAISEYGKVEFRFAVQPSGNIFINGSNPCLIDLRVRSVVNYGTIQSYDSVVNIYMVSTVSGTPTERNLGVFPANKDISIDISHYAVDGAEVYFRATNNTGNQALTSTYLVRRVNLNIRPQNNDWWSTPYVRGELWRVPLLLGININCNLVATLSKDGTNYSTKTIPSSQLSTNYNLTIDHPSLNRGASGVYTLRIDLIPTDQSLSDIPPVFFESNVLCILPDEGHNFIIVNEEKSLIDNYAETTLFRYSLFVGLGNPLVSIYSSVDGNNISVIEDMALTSGNIYDYTVSLAVERETTDNFELQTLIRLDSADIYERTTQVNNSTGYGATSGAALNISFSGRSNAEANRELLTDTITGTTITPEYTDLTWSEVDGYQNGFFRLLSEEKMALPVFPFKRNNDEAVTFEIKYRSRNILDYNSEILRIYDRFTSEGEDLFQGLKVTSNNITFFDRVNHSTENQSFPYTAEDINILTIVLYPDYRPEGGDKAYNAVHIYLNGQLQREYDAGSTINLNVNSNIIVGSDDADVDIYAVRYYRRALTKAEVENNTCNLQTTLDEKRAFKQRNNLRTASHIDLELVRSRFNVLIFETETGEIPHFVGWTDATSIQGNVRFFEPGNLTPKWECEGVDLKGQGTTSMGYFVWNIKWETPSSIDISAGRYPAIKKFTAKKNFASSMQSHKIGSTLAYDHLARLVGAIEENAPRVSIYQYPAVGFVRDGSGNYTFIGLYTVGPDKGDKATFGFTDKSLYMEGRDNGFYGSEFRAPWLADNVTVDAKNEKYTLNGEASWEDASKNPNYVNRIFVPAYNFVYQCSQRIAPVTAISQATDITMEYWIASTLQLYRYDNINKQWVDANINLKEQLCDKGYGLTTAQLNAASDVDTKNQLFLAARIRKFALEMEQYWDKRNALYHEAYGEIHNLTDNKAKNTYPYMLNVDGTVKLRWRHDDDDTMGTIENRGIPIKQYCNEVGDNYSMYGLPAQDVYNGMKSQFWHLLRLAFPAEYNAMMVDVLDAMAGGTVSGAMNYFSQFFFNNAQNYFSEALYNEDATYCYERAHAYIPSNPDLAYSNQGIALRQLLGNHYSAEKFFFKFRYLYMCSKYSTGVFGVTNTDTFQTRPYTPDTGDGNTFVITPAIYMYPAVQFGQTVVRGDRIFPGSEQKSWSYTFNKPDGDTVQRVNAMSYIKSIGDVYKNCFKEDITVNGPMLAELKFGSKADAGNIRNRATSISMSNAPSLRHIDMANMPTLAGEVDCSTCINLRSLYADNTRLTNISLCSGGPLRLLHIPATSMKLELINKRFLTDLIIEDPSNLETLTVINCNDYVLDMAMDLLNTLYNNS